jgi:hypothetical protein
VLQVWHFCKKNKKTLVVVTPYTFSQEKKVLVSKKLGKSLVGKGIIITFATDFSIEQDDVAKNPL